MLHHRALRGAPGNCVKARSLDLDVAMQLLPTRVSVEQLDPGPGPLRRGQHFGACQRATAFMSVSSDVKLMFKGILAAETEKKPALRP
jgi:hypothetical protein